MEQINNKNIILHKIEELAGFGLPQAIKHGD